MKIKLSGQMFLYVLALAVMTITVQAQKMDTLFLHDMSAFSAQDGNWRIVGDVSAPLRKTADQHYGDMEYVDGKGILLNINDDKHHSALLTRFTHQDIDLDLEFMMPAGSNSGIYLQGRYEVQLFDSWGVKNPKFSDLGGIFRNWESAPETAYAGKAPLVNVCRPPGIWQKMFISFTAPRFDSQGKKTTNARLNKVTINGVTIHENLEIPHPTGGPVENNETLAGPLMIQGDHGPVAFRNIRFRVFEDKKVKTENVTYKYWKGRYEFEDDFKNKKADKEGKSPLGLTWEVAPVKDFFGIQLSGDLIIPRDDQYYISTIYNGNLAIYIDNVLVKKISRAWDWDRPEKSIIRLTEGRHKIEVFFCRADAWLPPTMGIFFESDHLASHGIHAFSSLIQRESEYPILIAAKEKPRILRAFLDYNQQRKLRRTHTIGVGDPSGIHYVFDNALGVLSCIWRGDFVDATPMWHDRGDGSFRPMGDVVYLTNEVQLDVVSDVSSPHRAAFAEGEFRSRGYKILPSTGTPVFYYTINGMNVEDTSYPDALDNSLTRELKFTSLVPGVRFRIAAGKEIKKLRMAFIASTAGILYP
ncbi:MAG: DUF1080 domain-containing protein [Saprospiraceae bacterium]|nr:DUF1080 domain-containing protein [Saprospiraceae bacterium]